MMSQSPVGNHAGFWLFKRYEYSMGTDRFHAKGKTRLNDGYVKLMIGRQFRKLRLGELRSSDCQSSPV
jgi:hypothetical protein